MANNSANISERFLSLWAHYTIKYAWGIILFAVISSALSVYYAANNLGINTNTLEMLSPDLPFQVNRKRLNEAFPQDEEAVIVVVDSSTPESSEKAVRKLAEQLSTQTGAIKSVYIPGGEEYFETQGLLFLSIDELEPLAQQLTQAQPFIGRLAKDNSLNGLFGILSQAISETGQSLPAELVPFLASIGTTIEKTQAGIDSPMSWQQLFLGEHSKTTPTRRFLFVSPIFDYTEIRPAEQALMAITQARDQLIASQPDLKIRLTGEAAIEHEELETISHGTSIAGLLSTVLVCCSLLIGLRSFSLMLAALITLIAGLIISAGFATLTVGHLNLISIAFAVLYIGMGVDYAIHLILRFRDSFQNTARLDAIPAAIVTIGPSLFLCAITTSVGFFAFIPTDYSGVSELGLISGGSMFIALAITLTLLPALLAKFPLRPSRRTGVKRTKPRLAALSEFPSRHYWVVRLIALSLAAISIALLPKAYFDSDPINLRDPKAESVVTFKELLKSKEDSPFTLTALANDKAAALALSNELQTLKTVDTILSLYDFFPDKQAEKLAIIEDLNFLLGPQLSKFPEPSLANAEKQITALTIFIAAADSAMQKGNDSPELVKIRNSLQDFLATLVSSENPAFQVERLQNNLLQSLAMTMNKLLKGLEAKNVEDVGALPTSLSERWRNPDNGLHRVLIFPKKDLNNPENQREFVAEVRQIAPQVTGLPVIYQESGTTITRAFIQALTTALIAILFVLLIELRSLKDTLLVLTPLLLAACMTGAFTVISDSPLNYANIVAIPLLFGMGVDSGIHVIDRLKHMQPGDHGIMQTSTARGVFFSALTTFFSFSSLAFTEHPGTASMGALLAAGITCTLLSTLILLPALAPKHKH